MCEFRELQLRPPGLLTCIVVIRPDFCIQPCVCEGRANVILNQLCLLKIEHVHSRITCLAVQGFILNGNSVNVGAKRPVSLNVLDKILSNYLN